MCCHDRLLHICVVPMESAGCKYRTCPCTQLLLWETARTHEILAARGEQMLRNMCDDPRLGWYEKLPRHQLVMRGAWQNKHKGLYNGYCMTNTGRKFYQKLQLQVVLMRRGLKNTWLWQLKEKLRFYFLWRKSNEKICSVLSYRRFKT